MDHLQLSACDYLPLVLRPACRRRSSASQDLRGRSGRQVGRPAAAAKAAPGRFPVGLYRPFVAHAASLAKQQSAPAGYESLLLFDHAFSSLSTMLPSFNIEQRET